MTTGTPEELAAHVEETRRRLGDTVQELAAKADVKARAQGKATEMRRQVRSTADQAVWTARSHPVSLAAAVAVLAATVVLLLRHRPHHR